MFRATYAHLSGGAEADTKPSKTNEKGQKAAWKAFRSTHAKRPETSRTPAKHTNAGGTVKFHCLAGGLTSCLQALDLGDDLDPFLRRAMSDKPTIDVRQARIADLPAIQDFIQQCYGAEAPFKGEARWRWQYTASPYEPSKDDEAMVWIALNGEEVVGQMGSQPGRLLLDGRPLPVGWNLDLMVRPDHRGLGLAHKIHGAMAATGRTLTTLTMAPASRIVFVRAGALTLP